MTDTGDPEVGDVIIVNGRYKGEITRIVGVFARLRWTGTQWLGQRSVEYGINLERAAWRFA